MCIRDRIFAPHGSPWLPDGDGNIRRFVNEIVTEEESDEALPGGETEYISHFNLYRKAMQEIEADTAGIDILINNVGGRRIDIPTTEMPLDEWLRILDLNLNSTFLCTKLIGGAMVAREGAGRVINIASISGMVVNRDIGGRSYETSKAAVIHFTRATAADWAPHGVTVNAICPGGFMTEPNVKWAAQNPTIIETFKQQVPAGDFGQPEDLGPLAVYLASDASRYITVASIVIDGGYTLW